MGEQSVWKLIEAFGRILEKAGGPAHTHDVIVDRLSVGDRMTQLLDRIEEGQGSFRFEACFDLSLPEPELRNQVVVTLLAILELAKLKVVRVLQSPDAETLFITQANGVSIAAARLAARSAVSSDGRPPEEPVEAPAVEEPEPVTAEPEAEPDSRSPIRRRMSKRKNKTEASAPVVEPAAPAEEAFDEEATEESTNPDLDATPSEVPPGEDTAPFDGAMSDTHAGDDPAAEWDGATAVDGAPDLTAVEAAAPTRRAPKSLPRIPWPRPRWPTQPPPRRSPPGAWAASSRACSSPATSRWG